MTYNEIMNAADKHGARFETRRLATYLKKELNDKGILDRVLPYDERSWRDIAPSSDTLNYEFKSVINSTMDAMVKQGHLTDVDRYSLQIPSFAGSSNFENIPTSGIGDQMLEGLKKTIGIGLPIEGLPIEGLPIDLPSGDPSNTWEVVKEIINCINPF